MKRISRISIALSASLFSCIGLLAQPLSPPATPIDGGISLLIAGGAAYGISKLYKRKK